MTAPVSGHLVLADDVIGELLLSVRAVISKAARADFPRSVADDPSCAQADLAVRGVEGGLKPQSGTFTSTRHSSLIRSMFARVV